MKETGLERNRRWKAAVIGASQEALHGIGTAGRMGIGTVALDGNEAAAGLAAADRGLTVDISDEQAVINALRAEAPDFVLPAPIGRYLTTVGAVNDALGLPGVGREAALNCADKYRFHQKLSGAGLRDCHCCLVNQAAGGLPPGAAITYPAVLKPRWGSGSRGIYFLREEKELAPALREALSDGEDYVLEEAAPGTEYGVDGVMEGERFHLVLLREKLLTPPPARQAVGYLSVQPPAQRELYETVRRYLEQVTAALQLRDCLFHADLMVQGAGVFAIELSARPSGHNLHDLFTPFVTGVDLIGEFLRYLCTGAGNFTPVCTRPALIRYFDLENCVIGRVPEEEEVRKALPAGVRLQEWRCRLRPGDVMCPVTTGHSLMGRGFFLLEAEGLHEAGEEAAKEAAEEKALLQKAAEQVLQLVEVNRTGA